MVNKSKVLNGKKTDVKKLRLEDLELGTYQRPIDQKTVKNIVKSFNFVQFGVPVVAYRPKENKYYQLDGQHRLQAYKEYLKIRNEKSKMVSCQVFISSGEKEEADLYIKLQEERRPLKDYDKYKAGVIAEIPLYCEIEKWVKDNNFIIVNNPNNTNNTIGFVKNLISWWKKDCVAQKESLLVQRSILEENEKLDYLINSGLCELSKCGIDIFPHIQKIKKEGGKTTLLSAINGMNSYYSSYSGVSKDRIKALAILTVINKGKSRKIKMRAQDVL